MSSTACKQLGINSWDILTNKTELDFLVWKTSRETLHFIWHSVLLSSFSVCLLRCHSRFDRFLPCLTKQIPNRTLTVTVQPPLGFHFPNLLFVSIWFDLCFLGSKAFGSINYVCIPWDNRCTCFPPVGNLISNSNSAIDFQTLYINCLRWMPDVQIPPVCLHSSRARYHLFWNCYFSNIKCQGWTGEQGWLGNSWVFSFTHLLVPSRTVKLYVALIQFTVLCLHFVLLQVPALQQHWVFGTRIIHSPTKAGTTVSSSRPFAQDS